MQNKSGFSTQAIKIIYFPIIKKKREAPHIRYLFSLWSAPRAYSCSLLWEQLSWHSPEIACATLFWWHFRVVATAQYCVAPLPQNLHLPHLLQLTLPPAALPAAAQGRCIDSIAHRRPPSAPNRTLRLRGHLQEFQDFPAASRHFTK